MTSSQRPKTPDASSDESKISAPKVQEIKLNEELREIYSVSWNGNFILTRDLYNRLALYDCTAIHLSGEMKTSIQWLGGRDFIAACPLPVDMEKPGIEQFVIIGNKHSSFFYFNILQKEEKEFSFQIRSFSVESSNFLMEENLPESAIGVPASDAFIMPYTNILGFICAGHCVLVDIEQEEMLACLPIPRDLHKSESVFVAPNYLVFPDKVANKLRVYEISKTALKEKSPSHKLQYTLNGFLWAWPNANFLAVATEPGVLFYKLESQSNGSLRFNSMGGLYVPWLTRAKVMRNEFVFHGRISDEKKCEHGLHGYHPLTVSPRPLVEATTGNFFLTCSGIVVWNKESAVASLFPFATIPFSPPTTKEPYSKEKLSDALKKALDASRIPSPVVEIIGSYAFSLPHLFNPVRKLIGDEENHVNILKKYIERFNHHASESKGDAKQSESNAQMVRGISELLDLLETNLLRFDCVEQVLKKSKALKDLVEISSWKMRSLNPLDKQLVNAIRALRDSDDPRSQYKKFFNID